MDIEKLNTILNDSDIHEFYPFAFPSDVKTGSLLDVTGGTVERGGSFKAYLQVFTRESHPKTALDKAKEIRKYLQENLVGTFFDGKEVLQITPDTPTPLYIGEENGVYSVSWNYTILEG